MLLANDNEFSNPRPEYTSVAAVPGRRDAQHCLAAHLVPRMGDTRATKRPGGRPGRKRSVERIDSVTTLATVAAFATVAAETATATAVVATITAAKAAAAATAAAV